MSKIDDLKKLIDKIVTEINIGRDIQDQINNNLMEIVGSHTDDLSNIKVILEVKK